MITIVLADDHLIVRQGLRALLAAEPDLSVVAEAADGLEAATLVDRLQPAVLIVDLMLPGLNGLEVVRRARQCSSRTRVVVLSMYANEAYVLEALRNGAVAYVLKDAGVTDLVQAVRAATADQRYLSSPLSQIAIETYLQKTEATLDPYETLTSREREVLQLVAEGYHSSDIAARLCISPRTAETHRANFMQKLGLRGQAEVIRYALQRGILPLEN